MAQITYSVVQYFVTSLLFVTSDCILSAVFLNHTSQGYILVICFFELPVLPQWIDNNTERPICAVSFFFLSKANEFLHVALLTSLQIANLCSFFSLPIFNGSN